MVYFKLTLGIVLLIVFVFFFVKTAKRKGFVNALISFDIVVGFAAMLYLVVSSLLSL